MKTEIEIKDGVTATITREIRPEVRGHDGKIVGQEVKTTYKLSAAGKSFDLWSLNIFDPRRAGVTKAIGSAEVLVALTDAQADALTAAVEAEAAAWAETAGAAAIAAAKADADRHSIELDSLGNGDINQFPGA